MIKQNKGKMSLHSKTKQQAEKPSFSEKFHMGCRGLGGMVFFANSLPKHLNKNNFIAK